MVMISCSKESMQEPTPATNNKKESVSVVDGKLSFANARQADSIIYVLLSGDVAARNAWYDSLEFDEITSADQLPVFKERHKATFLFNEHTPDDWQPYLPCGKSGYSLIVNAQGDIIIGDSVQNYNFADFTETMYYKSQQAFYASQTPGTKGTVLDGNYLYCESGNRKFWAESFRSWYCVWIKLTAQRKEGLGWWNHYKESYCIDLVEVIKDRPDGWSHINVELSPVSNPVPMWTGSLPANYDVSIGTVRKVENYVGTVPMYPDVERKYYIYSSGIGVNNGGLLHINLPAVTG